MSLSRWLKRTTTNRHGVPVSDRSACSNNVDCTYASFSLASAYSYTGPVFCFPVGAFIHEELDMDPIAYRLSPDVIASKSFAPAIGERDDSSFDSPVEISLGSLIGTISDTSIFPAKASQVKKQCGSTYTTPDRSTTLARYLPPMIWNTCGLFWYKHKGLVLVLLSQLFGSLMNGTTRLLETDDSHGPPLGLFLVQEVEHKRRSTFADDN